MRRLFISAVIALVLTVAIGSISYAGSIQNFIVNLTSQVTGTLPVANGGTGQVGSLVFDSSAAASANSTAINTAFAAGGKIAINCPANSVLYVGNTLVPHSNSDINIDCPTIRATSNTGAILMNYAMTTAWTQIYDNSGVVANGPLSVIGGISVPAWSNNAGAGTAYVKGNYVNSNNNTYWESAATCTGSTTTGPTGTGSGITDGTCSWNYVTTFPQVALNDSGVNNLNLVALVHIPAHGLSIGNALWLSPTPDNIGSSNWWTGTQAAHTAGGPCDSAYFGVFTVATVNDANWVTVVLRRQPAAAFSGIPMLEKTADTHIKIVGNNSVLDYNSAVNTNTTPNWNAMVAALGGVYDLQVDGFIGLNSSSRVITLYGTSSVDIQHIQSGIAGVNSDRIKIYGPAFDVHLHDIYGQGGYDDIISEQPAEETAYYAGNIYASGDIINTEINNIYTTKGFGFNIYPTNSFLYMDSINIHNVYSNYPTAIGILCPAGTGATCGNIGSIRIADLNYGYVDGTIFGVSNGNTSNGISIDSVLLENIRTPRIKGTGTGSYMFPQYFSPGTINKLTIRNFDCVIGSSEYCIKLQGTYNDVLVENSTFTGQGNAIGYSSSATVNNFTVRNNTTNNGGSGTLNSLFGAPTVNVATFENNDLQNTYIGMNTGATSIVRIGGNISTTSTSGGLLRSGSLSGTKVYSTGGNVVTGSGVFMQVTSSGFTWSPYGLDIPCSIGSVSTTGANVNVTRTTGSYCYNTNMNPGSGTLNTIGPVVDVGTSSNSWSLMTNPTGQQY